MNVLYGLMQPDEGEILLDGQPVAIHSPRDAIGAKIGMVHQHFMLVPVFTVAENVTLGSEPVYRGPLGLPSLGLLDRRKARREVLDVQDLNVEGERGEQSVRGVSFQVRAGEILGVAGVQGNGQTELCEALMGLRPSTGSVLLNGTDLSHAPTRARLHAGIGYVPEDRSEDGLVADFSVADNLILDLYDQPPYASGIALNLDAIRESAVRRVEEYDVRTTSVETPAGTLSGGNQQKVVVAREMGRDVKLMVVSQPTRGLDVGSIEFVHKRLVAQRDEGAAVLIVSSELDEIYALADRIAVMYEGRIVAFCPPTIPEQDLGLLMAGSQIGGATSSRPDGQEPAGSAISDPGGGPETPVQEQSSHE